MNTNNLRFILERMEKIYQAKAKMIDRADKSFNMVVIDA